MRRPESVGTEMGKYQPILKAAQCGSFTKAAQLLGYTQPSLGYLINNVENDLGLKIFHRDQRGVTLTAAGERLLPLMREAEALEERIRDAAKDCRGGLIRVGVFPSVAAAWMPRVLRAFSRAYPETTIKLDQVRYYVDCELRLREHALDCCFYSGECPRGMEFIPLYEDPYLLVMRSDSPLAQQDTVSADDLQDYPLLPTSESIDAGSPIVSLFRGLPAQNRLDYQPYDNNMTIALVEQGMGVTILPRLTLMNVVAGRHVCARPLAEPQSRTLGILAEPRDKRSALTNEFILAVQQEVADWQSRNRESWGD